eukprot:5696313-Pleurochrysis_carterae.AAC.3
MRAGPNLACSIDEVHDKPIADGASSGVELRWREELRDGLNVGHSNDYGQPHRKKSSSSAEVSCERRAGK